MKNWTINIGCYYGDVGSAEKSFRTKRGAEKHLRENGYKWSKSEDMFCHDGIDNRDGTFGQWATVEPIEFIDE